MQSALVMLALSLAALLQGCGSPTRNVTTLTTTIFCPSGNVPWPATGPSGLDCQNLEEAQKEAHAFLQKNAPPWDTLNFESLDEGILPKTLEWSFAVREMYPWAELVPKDVWSDYVLPYANVNEPRVDWRTILHDKLSPLVYNSVFHADNITQVVSILNERLWTVLRPQSPIEFKAGQTPMIYDPMSIITYGFASCTGVSIMLVDALRSVGVPARLAGTPAWHGNASDGNHNWVEIWLGPGQGLNGEPWSFIEARPAGPGESLTNPCDKWFCNPAHFDGKTQAFAPQFSRQTNSTVYPMAWDLQNRDVPGVDRTAYYNKLCGACGKHTAASMEVAV
eukprot:TRINITY_DN48179_c0_g1_i1.p1 TRINITY_DN48179_c0_g1~~TRINITY_DN48179_c0_g1_i1.p1  ORF type:complete len:364 (-),score=60.62 TRINITY_DN48179_c0_g1_i1:64-1071(-)